MLIHNLSADSHLSQGRAPSIPTAFSQKRAIVPPNHPSLSFVPSHCSTPAVSAIPPYLCRKGAHLPCSSLSKRPQALPAAPKPQSYTLLPELALGCGLCWVRGNFSPGCWGPSPAAPCHRCWAQKHCQPRPWPPSAQIAASAGCTPCLMGYTGSPTAPAGRMSDPPWSGFSWNKSSKPLSHKQLFSIHTIDTTNQAKILPPASLYRWEKQAVRVRDALTFTLVLAIQWFLPPPSQLSERWWYPSRTN